MPNMNDTKGLKFGGNAGQRSGQSRDMMIKTFREAETHVRALWENPVQTWVTIWEHYDKRIGQNGLSYPCGYDAGLPTCIGHRAVVVNEEAKTAKEKEGDPGWAVRKVTPRAVAPFLTKSTDGRDFVNLFKMGQKFRDHIAELYTHYQSITTRDAKVVKVSNADDHAPGAEMRVSFSYIMDLQETDRPYVAELRALYLEVAAGLSAPQHSAEQMAAQARWLEGNLEIAGIPDIRDLLAEKYLYALGQYGTNLDNEMALAGQAAPPAQQPETVAVQPPAAANPHNPTADEMATLTAALGAAGIPIPPGADLAGLQAIASMYNVTAAAPAAAPVQPAVPTAAAAATPPAAAATTPAPAATTPAVDVATSDEDERLKEILDSREIEWPDDADHEVLVYLVDASNPRPEAAAVSDGVPQLPVTADGTPNFRAVKTPVLRDWLDAMLNAQTDPVQKQRFVRPEGAGRHELLKLCEQAVIPF